MTMTCYRLITENSEWLFTNEMCVRTSRSTGLSEAFVLAKPPTWHQTTIGARIEFCYMRSTFEGLRPNHSPGWIMTGASFDYTEINHREGAHS